MAIKAKEPDGGSMVGNLMEGLWQEDIVWLRTYIYKKIPKFRPFKWVYLNLRKTSDRGASKVVAIN